MKKALILSGGGARGAFQAGVWKYLTEINWQPDIICGTSVGAINAAAIGSGISADKLITLWTSFSHSRIFRLNFLKFAAHVISGRKIKPMLDTGPLADIIEGNINIQLLRTSRIKIVISAVNLTTGHLEFFSGKQIQPELLLASGSMPLIFPWQTFQGTPYWDGGVISNIPITPALDSGARDIIVVSLSPVGFTRHPIPGNFLTAAEHLFEQLLFGSYNIHMTSQGITPNDRKSHVRLTPLYPPRMLGFKSLLNFSRQQARTLIQEGYAAAKHRLGNGHE